MNYLGVFIAVALVLFVIGGMVGASMGAEWLTTGIALAALGLFLSILAVVIGCT